MSRSKTHADVEFHAQRKDCEDTEVFSTWEEASAYMMGFAGSIDVCVWSQEGAHWYGGDDAVDQYLEDEEASVFERWCRRDENGLFDCQGRIP
jgi:hypothetical protein